LYKVERIEKNPRKQPSEKQKKFSTFAYVKTINVKLPFQGDREAWRADHTLATNLAHQKSNTEMDLRHYW
jgi:hypothetical protein